MNRLSVRVIIQRVLIAVVAAGLLVPMAMPVQAANVVLSGRVYNGPTGSGYRGVTLDLCGAGRTTTGANGTWQVTVASNTAYCVRVLSGAPAGVVGPVTRNNPEVGSQKNYEYQLAGVNCYRSTDCGPQERQWDRAVDGGLDFIYGVTPPASTTPAPTPTPVPATPAPTPAATPAPAVALAAPTEFVAKLGDGGERVIVMSWKPGSEAPVAGYRLERSLDRQTWEALAPNTITETQYRDQTVSADIHYYYRLSALGAAGERSEFVQADVATGAVLGKDTRDDLTLSSDDKVATVVLLGDAVPEGTQCRIETTNSTRTGQQPTIAGPYQILCRTNDGQPAKPSGEGRWRFNLSSVIKGYENPQAVRRMSDGKSEAASGAQYDNKTKVLTVTVKAEDTVAVKGSVADKTWINYAVIGSAVLLLAAIVTAVSWRMARKQSYQEYLRSKYYNL